MSFSNSTFDNFGIIHERSYSVRSVLEVCLIRIYTSFNPNDISSGNSISFNYFKFDINIPNYSIELSPSILAFGSRIIFTLDTSNSIKGAED